MPFFVRGVLKFQNEVLPEKRELFARLGEGQAPQALFITCADSRIEVGMLTQTDPGQIFVLRNAGNIVPPHSDQTGGMTASIEYACAVLEVPHIVICGHTDCGAIKGAIDLHADSHALDAMPHVREWLGFARDAVETTEALAQDQDADTRRRTLTEQNVVLQLAHLRTHPAVAQRLAAGTLALHGWVYDIAHGAVDAWDEAADRFVPIRQRYGF